MSEVLGKDELAKQFEEKKARLIAELEAWYATETESIDGEVEAAAPAGEGGSVISVRPAIDSKRVVDATLVTEEVLGIELPPEIIKPGGYDTFEEMIEDIVPKLKNVFTGDLKVKKAAKEKVEA